MQFSLDAGLRGRIADRDFFHGFIRAIFCHRRKFLRSQLLSASQDRLDKAGVDRLLARLGLSGQERAEQLSVNIMLALSDAVQEEEKKESRI